MRPVGGYKREFWSPDYINECARPDPNHNSFYPGSFRRAQRGRSPPWRTPFHGAPVRRMSSSDARVDNVRHSGVSMKGHSTMPARNSPKMHKNYEDLMDGRGSRGDGFSGDVFRGRPEPSGRPHEYEDTREKPTSSGRFRGMRHGVQSTFEPSGGGGYRSGMTKADWVHSSGRAYSPEPRDVENSRGARKYIQRGEREENYEGRDDEVEQRNGPTARNRLIPKSRMLRANDNPVVRPRQTSTRSPPSAERRPLSSSEQRPNPATNPPTKKGFGQDLRPEEILVTRKYQSMYDAKENSSKVLPEEERRVKIVREMSKKRLTNLVEAPKSQRSVRDTDSCSSSDIASKRSLVDIHGDTDDRILNNTVRSQVEVRHLRSSSHDFGDKDDRRDDDHQDQVNTSDMESLDFDSSDDISLTKKHRSESRDDERPRERFDRKVNTRDPDDLRNSLARRRKLMETESKERSSASGSSLMNRKRSITGSRDNVKQRSSDVFTARHQDRKDSPPKRRRLSESHHMRPAVTPFKQPAIPPRRSFAGFHSNSYSFRGRRFPSFVVTRGRGTPRDFATRRTRPFTPRGFDSRR